MHVIHFSVSGMMCQNSCASTVQNALRSVPNIFYASASFATSSATVILSSKPTPTYLEELLEAIDMVGFDASVTTTSPIHCHTLSIEGMMCQNSCGKTCTNSLLGEAGVVAARADFSTQSAIVFSQHSNPLSPIDLPEAIEDVGFEAAIIESHPLVSHSLEADQLLLLLKDVAEKNEQKKTSTNKTSNKPTNIAITMDTTMETKNRHPSSPRNNTIPTSKGVCKMFFNVGGMSCASCSASIERHVSDVQGVMSVKVALLAERAEIVLDTSIPGASQHVVINTIRDLGFTCVPLRTELLQEDHGDANMDPKKIPNDIIRLRISGMSCASCSSKIEKTISKIKYVKSVSVGLVTEKLSATVAPGGPGVRDIISVIESLGFSASVDDNNGINGAEAMEKSHKKTINEWRHLFYFSLTFLLPMLLFQKVLVWIPFFNTFLTTHVFPRITWQTLIQMILSTPVQFYVGQRFYKAAWRGLKHKNCGMDFLISMGTTAAYLYSIISVIVACMVESFHGNHFFETSAMLLTFVVMGKLMEAHAKGKTSTALTKLMELQPTTALLMDQDWQPPSNRNINNEVNDTNDTNSSTSTSTKQKLIPINHVQINDVLKVLPGSSIPIDGTVVYGISSCNEAMITGEAMPVEKTIGDAVYGGTINHHGLLYVRADRVGSNTTIAQIVRLVEEAQTTKAPIQMFADRVSSIFAPTVVILSISTFIIWMSILSSGYAPDAWVKDANQSGSNFIFSFLFGIAVLVIACPCALGLATPTAVMVGTGVGAKHGILIKGGAALETAHGVDTVLFDKTGTLTTGKPACTVSLLSSDHSDPVDPKNSSDNSNNSNKKNNPNDLSSSHLLTNDEMCILVGCAELNSEHPLSTAIVQRAKNIISSSNNQLNYSLREPIDSQIYPGKGMVANININSIIKNKSSAYLIRKKIETKDNKNSQENQGNHPSQGGTGGSQTPPIIKVSGSSTGSSSLIVEIVIGNRKIMKENNIEKWNTIKTEQMMSSIEVQGNTAVAIAIDGIFVGVLGIADEIKEDTIETIERMHEMNLDVYIVTGDSSKTANAVGKKLNISQDRILSEVLPGDKAKCVQDLQNLGRIVAMVGDGINDSPALVQSNVGIALGSGAQIAIESAEIVIVNNKLLDVLIAFDLSRIVFRRIRMNFIWAMGYNLIGIPIAAGLLYPFLHVGLPPQFAGLAMAFSSVSVVMSSLHLKYYKTPNERDEMRTNGVWSCTSIPGQICSCCVDVIFSESKEKDGIRSTVDQHSIKNVRRRNRPKRGQYSKVTLEEDWGDEGVELV